MSFTSLRRCARRRGARLSFATPNGIEAAPPPDQAFADIVSIDALRFVADLHRRFEPRRHESLKARHERGAALRAGSARTSPSS